MRIELPLPGPLTEQDTRIADDNCSNTFVDHAFCRFVRHSLNSLLGFQVFGQLLDVRIGEHALVIAWNR